MQRDGVFQPLFRTSGERRRSTRWLTEVAGRRPVMYLIAPVDRGFRLFSGVDPLGGRQ